MRKPRKARTRSEKDRSDSLIAAELLERRYAFTATPLFDQFTSVAMEAVARGELTSERWIVHKLGSHEFSSERSCQSLTDFGGNAGWHADPIGTSFFRVETLGIDSSNVVDWARNNHEHFLIEPDLPIQVQKTPNDPSLWRLYGLNNYGQSGGTTDADLDAPEAWEITTGSRDVVIGVIDSGVDINHPDLAENIWVNPGETPNNGIDDDGNGFIDDVNGWDFYDNDNTPHDGNGHGTHVAGTIGAVGNNNAGITGVNWEVSLLPLRFLGDDGSGWTSDAVAAVNYATMLKRDFGINVVATNNSWGGGGYSQTLDRAIESANNEGIMFVAAAGNQGSNNDTNPSYPTNYGSPNVISVAALNRNDNLANFSNYGEATVDVGAPGVSIYSTLPGNSYGSFSGTSMAAPHVAGVVGLLNAAKPGISVTEVTNAIIGTVDAIQSLIGKTVSGGRVNAATALTSILGQFPTIDPLNNFIVISRQTKNIAISASDIDGDVSLEFSLSDFSSETIPATVNLTGSTLAITAINGRSGLFTIQVTASDTDSNTATESLQVEVLDETEPNGSVSLGKDVTEKLYANEFSIHDPTGKQISTSHYAGWQTLAVEAIDGVNTVLWEYTPTGRLHYWHTDASWNWQLSSGEHYDGSTEYYDAEINFEIDINNDGVIGAPEYSPIEPNGSVSLGKDVTEKLYANEFSIHDPTGKQISTSHYAGWQTLAVEAIDGVNTVLWEYTPTGRLHYWHTDASWNWQLSSGEHYDGSTEYYDAEINFEIDINNDGVIGAPEYSPIEPNGSVSLGKDVTEKLYANEFSIHDPTGKQISTSHYAGWQTLAVEAIDGVNTVLWEYTPTGRLHYWHTDASWNWQLSSGEHYDGSTEYYDAEINFEIDINNDGVIGAPEYSPIEPNGSVSLGKDVTEKLYANEFSIHDPTGKQISTSHYAGWQTLAVEAIDGVNTVLWEYTPTGRLHYWHTDASWNWQLSSGEHYDGSTEYYDAEINFEIDINNDGVIGNPITTDLQDFPLELLPGTSVVNLPVGYETSGLAWHQGLEKIFSVSDEGVVSMMNQDGTELVHWNVGGDFEAITVADHTSNFVYIGLENPDSIIEFDVSSGGITRTFDLTNWMTGPSNLGLEALTFVPDTSHPEGGLFYAGLQSTGEIFQFDLSIKTSQILSSVTFIDTLAIDGNHTDIADLSYDPSSNRILALYDSLDRIKVIEKDGELRTQWVAPGTEQEAILYVGGELFIGEDFGGSSRGTITQFSPFTSIVA